VASSVNKKNAVVIVVNQAFAHYAKPLINSIKRNWISHPEILLFLSHDVNTELEDWFSRIDKVTVKRFNPADYEYRKLLNDGSGRFDSKDFNDAGYFIINFWDDTFAEYDDLLILDADMLVLKDLTELINTGSFTGVSAANSRMLPVFSFDQPIFQKLFNLTSYYLKALSMGIYLKPYQSLNSGVVRIAKNDRSKSTFRIMLNLLKTFRKGCPGDQEIILLWMKKFNKKVSLDFRMNFQARFFNALQNNDSSMLYHDEIRKAAEDVHIIHFNGPKPDSAEFLHHPWTLGRTELVEMYESYLS